MLLVRHAAVVVDKTVPSTKWRLSDSGRQATRQLAHQFSHLQIEQILTSHEPKAVQTGAVLAAVWGIPAQVFPGLHEHERADNAFVADQGKWHAMVARFLTERDRVVFGEESAAHCATRLKNAFYAAQHHFPDGELAIVTHGRLLTAFLSQHNPQIDPILFWQRLPMPAALLLNPETFKLRSVHS